jgi:hypothetical protein
MSVWDKFDEVLDDNDIPLFGLKFVVVVNEQGVRAYEIFTAGDINECAMEVVGALEIFKRRVLDSLVVGEEKL